MFKPKLYFPSNIRRTKPNNALITESFKNDSIDLLSWLGIDLENGSTTKFLSEKGTYESATGSAWGLIGNTGTDDTVNFIGTTDAQDFVIKTNNVERARFYSDGTFISDNPDAYTFGNTDNLLGFGIKFAGAYTLDTLNDVALFVGISEFGDKTATLHAVNTNTFQESEVSVNYFAALSKQGVLIKSIGNTGEDYVGIAVLDEVTVNSRDYTSTSTAFQVIAWNNPGDVPVESFKITGNGDIVMSRIRTFADDVAAAAATPPVPINGFYRETTTGYVKARIS